jgi:hypothetical protein
MPVVTFADVASVDYTTWTRDDLVRLRGQLEAEPESADEARLVAAEIGRRETAQPVQQTAPFSPPTSVSPVLPPAVTPAPPPVFTPAAAGESRGVQWWVLASAGVMVVGAFGPWVNALGLSAAGTDGSNDGWLVVGAAVFGALLFYVTRTYRAGGIPGLLAGIAGIAVTFYDRAQVQNAIDEGGDFAQAVAHVGWGLNLALAASISLTIASAVHLVRTREQGEQEEAFQPPSATPSSVLTAPPVAPLSSPSPPPG